MKWKQIIVHHYTGLALCLSFYEIIQFLNSAGLESIGYATRAEKVWDRPH
jgi:hypothetical protein